MRYVPDGAPRTPGGREVACAAGRPAGRSVEQQQPPPVKARAAYSSGGLGCLPRRYTPCAPTPSELMIAAVGAQNTGGTP